MFEAAISTVYITDTAHVWQMRLHTGWNHSPTKAQTTPETFHTVLQIKELRTRVSIDQKGGEGDPFPYECILGAATS